MTEAAMFDYRNVITDDRVTGIVGENFITPSQLARLQKKVL